MDRRLAQRGKIRPLDAWQALSGLLRDPDDTSKVFALIDALSGRSFERVFARFANSESGARLLVERPSLVDTLEDREMLASLPAGSFGRTYLDFVSREQISAGGLIDASEGRTDPDPAIPEEFTWFGSRLRDMHDLWHVVTGYNRDLVGEASLLAFTYAQTRNRGIGVIVLAAYVKAGREAPNARSMIREGYRRGKRAAWLPAQDWESLLRLPLHEVRERLAVGDPPVYEQLRSEGAPALA